MRGSLKQLIQTKEELLSMPAAALAACLLFDTIRHEERVFPSDLAQYVNMHFSGKESAEAAMEALGWLIAEGLLVPDFNPGASGGYRLTRAARNAASKEDIEELVRARQILPKGLHPLIIEHAVPIFHSGSYDTAVGEAFKQLEIVIRDGSTYSTRDGVDLMRAAFGTAGVLTDTTIRTAEQEGVAHLYAGAIAVFRNPSAHRNLATDSHQAAQLLVFASLLIETAERLISEALKAGRL